MHPAPFISNGGPNTKKNYWRTVFGQHGVLADLDIGAPIYWRTDVPRAITIGGPIVSHLLLADRTKKINKKRGGPNSHVRLAFFSSQSHIN
jgi:hypothetical protein